MFSLALGVKIQLCSIAKNFSCNFYHWKPHCVLLSLEEYEQDSREKTAKFLKQPRTLSLAIVPGEHIVSIALAMEQQEGATPTCLAAPPSPSDSDDSDS